MVPILTPLFFGWTISLNVKLTLIKGLHKPKEKTGLSEWAARISMRCFNLTSDHTQSVTKSVAGKNMGLGGYGGR
jgi:hypothetical protein